MNIHHRFRGCAYLLITLSYCALAVAESAPIIFVLGLIAVLLSWFIVERPQHGMPRWLINIGVLVSSVLLFWELVLLPEFNLLSALAHFMAAILACKLFERKSNRDFSQILTLSLLIMVTGAILNTSLAFGTLMAIYLALGLYIVLLFHLRLEFASEPLAPQAAPANPRLRSDIRFLSLTAAATLLCIAMIVFVLFPRNKGRELLASLAMSRGPATTGFSDSVSFTDFGRLHQSYAVVMEVNFSQRAGGNVTPLGSSATDFYFRGATFEHYELDHSKWTHLTGQTEQAYRVKPNDVIPLLSPGIDDITKFYDENWVMTQQITLYSAAGNTLFAVGPATVLHDMHDIRRVFRNPRDGNLTFEGPTLDHVSYQVDSPQLGLYKPGVFQWPTDDRGNPIHLPQQDVPPIIKAIAIEAAGDLAPPNGSTPNPQQANNIAQRIETYLRSNYAYSLDSRAVDSKLDPVTDFLKNRQKIGGHCQYFASAMVLMCRALNIDARLVTGYHSSSLNSFDNVCTVRQKDAHAWVEVLAARPEWKSEAGWLQFDPTPASDSTPTSVDSWTLWFRELMEVAQRGWLANIVSFDNGSRTYIANAIVQPIAQWFINLGQGVLAFGHSLIIQTYSPSATFFSCLRVSEPTLVLLACAAWGLGRWVRWRRSALRPTLRTIKTRAKRHQLSEELSFFDDLIRLLRRKGERRSPSQTPREFVRAACQSVAIAEDDALWLIDRFYELRFGSAKLSPSLQTEIINRLSQVRTAIKRG